MTLRGLFAPLAYPAGGQPSPGVLALRPSGTRSRSICYGLNREPAGVRSPAEREFAP